MTSSSDDDLIRGCREQDTHSWNQLVARYERLVFSVARGNGLDDEDSSDVTQMTFLELFSSLDKIQDSSRIRFWLMTVARRQSWRVRNQRRKVTPLDSIPELSEEPLEDWLNSHAVREAAASLSEAHQKLLTALFFDPSQPSYKEIAAMMGRSVGSLGSMRGRALDKLRETLE